MYAIIETGGKQYKVSNGDVIFVEKLGVEDDATVDFKVVALSDDNGIKVGTPYVEGATVTAKVIKTGKAKKDSLGRAVFSNVTLKDGENTIEVRSGKLRDTCKWILDKNAIRSIDQKTNKSLDGAV